MRSFYSAFLLVLIFGMSAPCLAAAGDTPLDDIKKAAKEGMKTFIKTDRLGHLSPHGFGNKEDVEKAQLGEGFEIFTISPEKILDESAPQNIQSLVTTTNQWSFIILIKGEAKTIVTVDLINGKWMAVELGPPEFAKIMANFFKIWPVSAGYRCRYVRVYQANASFIEVYLKDELIGIVPSTSLMEYQTGEKPTEYNPRNLVSPNGVMSALRKAVKKNVDKAGGQ